ncbi:MAG TPA: ubiquinol-cytochrome c reductase cytochrome b subunit [bacterium]|nr:ubiquinol-cytochrome c reductase cytochrome b subunit [bacterium]
MIRRLVLWLDDRLGAASFARKALRKAFPDHWAFMLGEVALYAYLALVVTGVFLTFFFTASGEDVVYQGSYAPLRGERMSAAYASVLRLSFDVRSGLVMRQIHHWAALVFVAAIVAHALRVFFTGAFRRPRELNWLIGTGLLLLAMAAGFTGYSLPDDLLSGTGIRIAYSVLLSIPVVGTWAAFLFFGGEFPAPITIGRLLALHIMLIQAFILGALGLHLAIIWHQKHTQFRAPGRTEDTVVGSPLWPSYAMKSVGLGLAVVAVLAALGGLFQINPVWLYGPYDPTTVSSPAQPDWYVGWLEGALRLMPDWEIRAFGHTVPEPFFPGVLLPGLLFGAYALWPFIEQRVTGDRAVHHFLDRVRDAPGRSAVGAAGLAFMVLLTLAGSNDIMARFFSVPVETVTVVLRGVVLIVPAIAGWVTYIVCRELKAAEARPSARWHALRRGPGGGYVVEDEER